MRGFWPSNVEHRSASTRDVARVAYSWNGRRYFDRDTPRIIFGRLQIFWQFRKNKKKNEAIRQRGATVCLKDTEYVEHALLNSATRFDDSKRRKVSGVTYLLVKCDWLSLGRMLRWD